LKNAEIFFLNVLQSSVLLTTRLTAA